MKIHKGKIARTNQIYLNTLFPRANHENAHEVVVRGNNRGSATLHESTCGANEILIGVRFVASNFEIHVSKGNIHSDNHTHDTTRAQTSQPEVKFLECHMNIFLTSFHSLALHLAPCQFEHERAVEAQYVYLFVGWPCIRHPCIRQNLTLPLTRFEHLDRHPPPSNLHDARTPSAQSIPIFMFNKLQQRGVKIPIFSFQEMLCIKNILFLRKRKKKKKKH